MNSRPLADALISTGAVQVSVAEPFRWTSGLLAPLYVDCRSLLGYPEARRLLTEGLASMIDSEIGLSGFDVIAGGATAGIPIASLLSERFSLPLAYVRKESKGYGRGRQVEGADVAGKRVLLFDELISRGSSVTAFVPALREAGAIVEHLVVLLSYDTHEVRQTVKRNGVVLHPLLTLEEVLNVTPMSEADRVEVTRFRETHLV